MGLFKKEFPDDVRINLDYIPSDPTRTFWEKLILKGMEEYVHKPFIVEIIVTFCWVLGQLHDWRRDNMGTEILKMEKPEEKPKAVQPQSIVQETVTLRHGALADPGKGQPTITLAVSRQKDGWTSYKRFDGKYLSPDFSELNEIDEQVWKQRRFSETDIRNYLLVRPHVLLKMKNSEIAKKLGKSIAWVEKYAAAVRQTIEERMVQYRASPIVEF